MQKTSSRPRPPSDKTDRRLVTVRVRLPEAKDVRITGDFTKWSPEGIPLDLGQDGERRATLLLEPGSHQYRLIVDGAWADHPEAERRVANPYGSENCVLEVG